MELVDASVEESVKQSNQEPAKGLVNSGKEFVDVVVDIIELFVKEGDENDDDDESELDAGAAKPL